MNNKFDYITVPEKSDMDAATMIDFYNRLKEEDAATIIYDAFKLGYQRGIESKTN